MRTEAAATRGDIAAHAPAVVFGLETPVASFEGAKRVHGPPESAADSS